MGSMKRDRPKSVSFIRGVGRGCGRWWDGGEGVEGGWDGVGVGWYDENMGVVRRISEESSQLQSMSNATRRKRRMNKKE